MVAGNVHRIYWGKIDAMCAEVSALNPADWGNKTARYSVLIDGDGQWDTEAFDTATEAQAEAQALAGIYNVPVLKV